MTRRRVGGRLSLLGTVVRGLGECGGHFWAPAYEELEELDECPHLARNAFPDYYMAVV